MEKSQITTDEENKVLPSKVLPSEVFKSSILDTRQPVNFGIVYDGDMGGSHPAEYVNEDMQRVELWKEDYYSLEEVHYHMQQLISYYFSRRGPRELTGEDIELEGAGYNIKNVIGFHATLGEDSYGMKIRDKDGMDIEVASYGLNPDENYPEESSSFRELWS